ncbi:MAG: hypothetical protein GXO79_00410 [Chlorobi bacterium]|nr:hypothetical protein [Chlorobiota bacterium]
MPIKKTIFFTVILYIIFRLQVNANVEFSPNVKMAYLYSMNLEFKKAVKFIELEKSNYASNNLIYYNQNLLDFLRVLIDDNNLEYELFLSNTEIQIEKLLDDEEKSAWKFYSISEIYLHRAILRFLHNQYLYTGYDIYQSFQYIKKNIELYPAFQMNNKLLGIYNVMFGLIPSDFKWIANLIGIKGDLQNGLKQLERFANYANKNHTFNIEGFMIQFFTNIFLNEDILNNTEFVNEIIENSEKSSIIRYSVSSALLKRGKLKLAEKILFENNQSGDEIPIQHFNYVKGICKLYDNKNETERFFTTFLSHYSGRFYKNNARLKLAWYYLLHNDSINYNSEINKIIASDDNVLESDKHAYSEAVNKKIININLLKSRILFDGGKYKETLQILKKSNNLNDYNKKEKVEYFYRMARAEQKLKKFEKAINNFNYVIENGEGIHDYYRSFSLLQTAKIYQKINNIVKAKEYYKRCLSESGRMYYYSFEFKVKIGLYLLTNANSNYSISCLKSVNNG